MFQRAQQVKDMGYEARFILVKPPSAEILQSRLKEGGLTEEEIAEAVKRASDGAATVGSDDIGDITIEDNDLEEAYKVLEEFIYGSSGQESEPNGGDAPPTEPMNGVET
jgi:guanylate kinase